MKLVDTFEKHRSEPDKSLYEYTKEVRLKLGQEISKCKKIYLDTKYWLLLRDVILQKETNKKTIELLSLLRQGVQSEKLICPISEDIFSEILQSDPTTLYTTVSLVDELSKGVSILSTEERIRFEILQFVLRTTKGDEYVLSPDVFVWIKPSYILCYMQPPLPPHLPPEEKLVLEKAFFDQMWSISLSEMIQTMGMKAILRKPKLKDISKSLNKGKIKYAHENNSFKQIFLSEIGGILDLYKAELEDALIYLFESEKGRTPEKEEIESSNAGQIFANIIYNALERNKFKTEFPTLCIGSSLYASVRLDIERKFKKNDLHDFRHAQTALPYFDFFFTERSLKDLVARKNIALDRKYNCKVVSHPHEAVDCINKIFSC